MLKHCRRKWRGSIRLVTDSCCPFVSMAPSFHSWRSIFHVIGKSCLAINSTRTGDNKKKNHPKISQKIEFYKFIWQDIRISGALYHLRAAIQIGRRASRNRCKILGHTVLWLVFFLATFSNQTTVIPRKIGRRRWTRLIRRVINWNCEINLRRAAAVDAVPG